MQKHIYLCLLVVLTFFSLSVSAQDDEEEHHKGRRSEFGINYPLTNTSFFYRYRESSPPYYSVDTSIVEKIKSKGGFGFSLGGFIPIAPSHAKTNMLALSITGSFNMITWDINSINDAEFNDGSIFYDDIGITSSTMIISFLMGFDYKYGCDANLDKGQRFCFTMGGGASPIFAITQFGGIPAGAAFKVKPYAKVEIGMMAGICMKLRVLYTIGDLDYIRYHDKTDFTEETLSMTDKSGLTVSLVLMPLSFKWEKKDKWDR